MKEPPDNFGAGVICAHLGITQAYMTVLKDHKLGDIACMAQATGRSNNQMHWLWLFRELWMHGGCSATMYPNGLRKYPF